jgi:tetratricopeptide (TPR) repeat protein
MIYFLGDTVEVENLSQTNPTILNGKILKERTRLKSGDILKVGRMTLLFVNPSEKPETELMVRKPNTALIVGISAVLLLLIAGTTTFLYLNQRKNEAQSSLSLAISTFATAENEQDPEKILKNFSLVKDYAQKALNLDKSLSQAREFVSKADSLLNAWRNVVDALKLVNEGKFDEAMENLDRVRPILGDRLIFNQIYAPLANRLSAIQNVELAKALIQKGDYKRALLLIESALEGDPENEQLLALKGTVENLMSSQRPAKAEVVRRIFERKIEEVKAEGLGTATTSIQIQQTPKLSSEVSVNLPKVEVSLGEVKPTINLNTSTIDKRTQMIEAYKRGDLTTTLRLATEILSENPQDYTAKRYQQLAQLENKAISYEKAGDKQKALETWQMVLNYDKGNQRALNAISRLKQ